MASVEDVRAAALRLPSVSGRDAQFLTNDTCFAEVVQGDLLTWHDGAWTATPLTKLQPAEAEKLLCAAWRQRATKRAVATLDYAIGREDLTGIFAELRTWPDLTERGVGDFAAFGRAFLHFHHSESARHADVKEGLGWGAAIPFPMGRPSTKVASAFFVEVRRRLDITRDAVAAAKAQRRSPNLTSSAAPMTNVVGT
jgi:hypothetical protein